MLAINLESGNLRRHYLAKLPYDHDQPLHCHKHFCSVSFSDSISDAANVTSFIDSARQVHPVYATSGMHMPVLPHRAALTVSGNLSIKSIRNRETVALLPIFDKARHPSKSKKDIALLKKQLFMACFKVFPNHQADV